VGDRAVQRVDRPVMRAVPALGRKPDDEHEQAIRIADIVTSLRSNLRATRSQMLSASPPMSRCAPRASHIMKRSTRTQTVTGGRGAVRPARRGGCGCRAPRTTRARRALATDRSVH